MNIKDAVRTFVIPDLHCPFHDPAAVELLIKIIRYKKPERIVFLGDAVTFDAVSSYLQNPDDDDNINHDLNTWHDIAKKIQLASPNAERYFVSGNHEDRLRRYIWKNAPKISSLVSLENVMQFNRFGIKFCGEKVFLDNFLFTHGSLVSPYSSYTAKREHDKHGCQGFSGHTHRLGMSPRRLERGDETWYECGCLCDLDPKYAIFPNWKLGWAVFTVTENIAHVDLIDIKKGYKVVMGDNIYSL